MLGISNYERQYMEALINIYNNGYEDGTNERTGIATKRLPGIVFRVDLEEEFPILKSKFVAGKTALREILWIYQKFSPYLKDFNGKIWDEWATPDKNGELQIGKAYGYQVGKPVDIYLDPIHKTSESFRHYDNQTQFVLELLREDPTSRWANVTLWNVSELKDMNLVPCCHTATWNLDGGRLNCVLDQRSGDMPYGVPFNTTQYAELTMLFARDLGVKPGILTHVIADAHIYANQMKGVDEQIDNYNLLKTQLDNGTILPEKPDERIVNHVKEKHGFTSYSEVFDLAWKVLKSEPRFVVNTDETDFFKISDADCSIEDYENMGKIDFGDIAV